MQGVLVFASSAARAAAITSPQEGQYSYLKDTNSTEYYDGAAWIAAPIGDITGVTAGVGITGGGTSGTVTITNDMATTITAAGDIVVGTGSGTYDNLPIGTTAQVLTADTTVSPYKVKWATPAAAASGMTLVTRQSFSAVATTGTTFDGIFTSTYESYLVVIESLTNGSNGGDLQMQLRYAGPTTQTSTYYGNSYEIAFNQTALTFLGQSSTSEYTITPNGGDAGQTTSAILYFNKVGSSSLRPKFYGSGSVAGVYTATFGGMNDTSRIYTGLLFKADTGNVTGTIAVYGLAK
jgi:hypothetical protein